MASARLIAVLLAALAASPAAAQAELTVDSMYSADGVTAIDLTLPPASVEALEEDPTGEYVEGTFRIAETAGTPDSVGPFSAPLVVGVRLKGGAGSFEPLSGKAAFKVKFNEFVKGQKFLGLKKLTLNNMAQDPSMTHEVLAYDLFRAVGTTAPQTGFANVYVNGENYGVHLNVESLDDVALEARYGELVDGQHLYEGEWHVDLEAADLDSFEVDEGDEENRADLEALIAAATATDPPSLSSRMAPVADLGQMALMWGVERYIGHWDGYSAEPNNYYLFSRPNGIFEMLPWGTDQTWTNWWRTFTGKGGLLFEQCLADEPCLALFRAAVRTAWKTSLVLDSGARVSSIATLLAPWQELETEPRRPHDAEQVEEGVTDVLEFLERRPELAADWLGDEEEEDDDGKENPLPATPQPPAGEPQQPTLRPALPLSPRLEVDRSQLGRGVLITEFWAPAAGAVAQVGRIATAKGMHRACAVEQRVAAPGTVELRCLLSDASRARLARERLTLWLASSALPDGAEPSSLRRAVVLPRQAG